MDFRSDVRGPPTFVAGLVVMAMTRRSFASIVAGAHGYLLKQTRGQAVVDAIHALAKGARCSTPT